MIGFINNDFVIVISINNIFYDSNSIINKTNIINSPHSSSTQRRANDPNSHVPGCVQKIGEGATHPVAVSSAKACANC